MQGLVLFLWLFASGVPAVELPTLQIESPPELAAVRDRLQAIPPGRFADIFQFLGSGPGLPVRVELVPESSVVAHSVQPWIAGFAVGESSLVVLFPARSPGYPDNTLEDVLRHELAHVLIARASGGGRVPRWFNEGLAMEVERERRFQDQTELFYQLVKGGETDLRQLDALFSGSQDDQIRAYALAGAFIHDLLQSYGPASAKTILARMQQGASFDTAFMDVTGIPASSAESQFWRRQRIWTSWVPVLTASTTLWLAITMLALLAIVARRRRNRQIQKQWEKEDQQSSE
ncbi:MAG TPA: hypothetical protein VGK48_11965 [Terriglobia bacterium]|jgi:hypothetical protein